MFEDFIQQINEEISDYQGFEETAKYLVTKRKSIIELKEEIKSLLKELDEFSVAGNEDSQTEIIKQLKELMKKNALIAIAETKEFDLPEFRAGLLKAIDDDNSYRLSATKAGQIVIAVDFDLTAGTLADYGHAITETRRDLEIGRSKSKGERLDPELASTMWMEKYYKPAREGEDIPQPKEKTRTSKRKVRKDKKQKREYNRQQYIDKYYATITTRIRNFSGFAPYWRILNYGNAGLKLSSNWDGTAYPLFEPTRFVENTVAEVQKLVVKNTTGQDVKSYKEILNDELDKLGRALKLVDEKTEKLDNLSDIEETHNKKEFTITEVRKALSGQFGGVDLSRILDLINKLQEGTINPERRVELTRSGSKERVRIRVKRLYQEVIDYKETM